MRKRIDDDMYNIGSRIRIARKRADLTQEELSERISVTPQYLSDLERGLVGTSIPTLIKICKSLNASSDFILFGGRKETNDVNTALIERIQYLPEHHAELVERMLNTLIESLERDSADQLDK